MSHSPLTESAFARRLVRATARRLVARRRVRGWDADDVAQELFLRLWAARRRFDPTRGALEAFVATVVDRAVADLVRRQQSAKRAAPVMPRSGPIVAGSRITYDPVPAIDRALDVAAVLARLTADLQLLARLLKHETVSAVARRQGVSRTAIRRRVRELRAAFERHKRREF